MSTIGLRCFHISIPLWIPCHDSQSDGENSSSYAILSWSDISKTVWVAVFYESNQILDTIWLRTTKMDVTRKKMVKKWKEDPEWHWCAVGSIGPLSASKQKLLSRMRELFWLLAVTIFVINEFMKPGLHISRSSILLIIQRTTVETPFLRV